MASKDSRPEASRVKTDDGSSDADEDNDPNIASLRAKIEEKKRELAAQREKEVKAAIELKLQVEQSAKAMDEIMHSAREIHEGPVIEHKTLDLHVPSPPPSTASPATSYPSPAAPAPALASRPAPQSPALSETSHKHSAGGSTHATSGHHSSHHHRSKSTPNSEHRPKKEKKEKKDKEKEKEKDKEKERSHHSHHPTAPSPASITSAGPSSSSSLSQATNSATTSTAASQTTTSKQPSNEATISSCSSSSPAVPRASMSTEAPLSSSTATSAPGSPVKPPSFVSTAPRSPFTQSRPRSNSNSAFPGNSSAAATTAGPLVPRSRDSSGAQRKLTLDEAAPNGREASPARDPANTFKCPEAARVKEMIRVLFGRDVRRAWLLMGYQDAETIVSQGMGVGPLSELLEKLDDAKIQYALIRVPTSKPQVGSLHMSSSKDLCVTWIGPRVGMMEKARKQIHHGGMNLLLKPSHADINASDRSLFTGENLLYCAEPHGGHELMYDAKKAQNENSRVLSVLFDAEYGTSAADTAALTAAQAIPQNFTASTASRDSSSGHLSRPSSSPYRSSPMRQHSSGGSGSPLKESKERDRIVSPSVATPPLTSGSPLAGSPVENSKLTAAQRANKKRNAILASLSSPLPAPSSPATTGSPAVEKEEKEVAVAEKPAPAEQPAVLPSTTVTPATPEVQKEKVPLPERSTDSVSKPSNVPSLDVTPLSSSPTASTESSPATPSPLSGSVIVLPRRPETVRSPDEDKARRLASLQRVKFDHLQEEAKKLREQRQQLEKAKKELEQQTNTEEWKRLEERAREQARLEEVLYEAFKQQALRKKEEERQQLLQQQLEEAAQRTAANSPSSSSEKVSSTASASQQSVPSSTSGATKAPTRPSVTGSAIQRPQTAATTESLFSSSSAASAAPVGRPKTMAFPGGVQLTQSAPIQPYQAMEAASWDEQLKKMREDEQNKKMQKIEEIRKNQEQKKHDQIFTLRKPDKIDSKR